MREPCFGYATPLVSSSDDQSTHAIIHDCNHERLHASGISANLSHMHSAAALPEPCVNGESGNFCWRHIHAWHAQPLEALSSWQDDNAHVQKPPYGIDSCWKLFAVRKQFPVMQRWIVMWPDLSNAFTIA